MPGLGSFLGWGVCGGGSAGSHSLRFWGLRLETSELGSRCWGCD